MKTVKFVNKDKSLFMATVKKKVHDLFQEEGISTKGNSSMIIKTIVMLSLFIVPFVLIMAVPMSGWIIFPLSVIMGLGMAGIGMSVMHDAVHGSLSKYAWINKLMGSTIYLLGGNKLTWKVQHNVLHHTFTNIPGYDQDIEPKVVFRLSKHTPLRKIHRFQYIYFLFFYSLMTLNRLVNDFKVLGKYSKEGLTAQQGSNPRYELIKMIIFKVAYIFVVLGLPFLFSGMAWWLVLLGFLVMHMTAGATMSVVFQMAHVVEDAQQPVASEEGVIENEWAIHEVQTTANFGMKNRFLTWMIGGLNFQIEHHLFPNICHVHYRKISRIVQETVEEFGIKYNHYPTFSKAVISHVRTLKTLGREN